MSFANRGEAAEQLVQKLKSYQNQNPLVLAIPRGAIYMAKVLAEQLNGDLDVVLVHKLGAPGQPELAVGAVDETGEVYLNPYAAQLGVGEAYLDQEKKRELALLKSRRQSYTPHRKAMNPEDRVVIVVDDGIATGSTMISALNALRKKNPKKLLVATAVAPPSAIQKIREYADEVFCLETPEDFYAVGQFFQDFSQVSDEEVIKVLASIRSVVDPLVQISAGAVVLKGDLMMPSNPEGIVLFAHGSGSSRHSPRNQFVARKLQKAQLVTLLFDLLTEEEDLDYETRFNIQLLTQRLIQTTQWLVKQAKFKDLPLGYFGASTGAAAALGAAAELGSKVSCVVSRGGRPDMAMEQLGTVQAATLLIVGGYDEVVIELNQQAYEALNCQKEMKVIPGATHLFEEPGKLEEVANLARDWFERFLKG